MEKDVLGTGRVLEDGEDCGHGAPDVCCVKGHCNMDRFLGADIVIAVIAVGVVGDGGAIGGVVELGGFFELLGSSSTNVCVIVGGGRGG